MQRLWIISFLLIFSVFLTSCTDDILTSSQVEDTSADQSVAEASTARHEINPHAILSNTNRFAEARAPAKGPAARDATTDAMGFASPLFGLATAPNGDILVADAGAGVATLNGTTDIPLPGISSIGVIGRRSLWATVGLMGSPGEDTGQALYRVSKGTNQLIADLFAFEEANNPDGEELIDSNPFDVQSLGGRSALVVDAGGNDLLRVNNQGQVEVLAVFPSELVSTENIKDLVGCPSSSPLCGLPPEIPAQPVPTSVAIGPDGYYYVGELKGFPAPSGASNIWRIAPNASGVMCGSSPDCEKVFAGGFTSIIDLTFDESGTLHVAELDEKSWFAVEHLPPSALAGGTINACDVDAGSCTEVTTGIPILTAITFGNDGTLWATKNALIPSSAEVIEVE